MSTQSRRWSSAVRGPVLPMVLIAVLGGLSSLWGGAYAAPGGLPNIVQEALDMYALAAESDFAGMDAWHTDAQAALAAGAQPVRLAEVLRRAYETGRTAEDISGILNRVARLARRELPINPVLNRFLEGMAKGAAYPRIVAVADSLEVHLANAAGAVDDLFRIHSAATPDRGRLELISDAAYVLALGIPPAELHQCLSLAADTDSPFDEAHAPALAMGFLVSGRLSSARSLEVVEIAWQHGYRGVALQVLGQKLGSLAKPGRPALDQVIEEVLTQIREGADRDRVFEGIERILPGVLPSGRPVSQPMESASQAIEEGSDAHSSPKEVVGDAVAPPF